MIATFLLEVALAATVPVLDLRGPVDPGTADYVAAGIAAAEAADAPAVVLRIDTPGGLVESARDIVRAELDSDVPVIAWVAPSGARATSAGVFVTMAAHVAVMAPGTTIGAAHPISLGGGREPAANEEKAVNDAAAWARAIAERRGRNADWAELAVRESVSITDRDALEVGVVDHIVADESALRALNGLEIRTAAGVTALDLSDAEFVEVPMSLRQRTVHALGDPNILFLLLVLGMLAVSIEVANPGFGLPGALGALLLIAAAVGLSLVPFQVGGLMLIGLAFVLFLVEAFAGGHGALAAGGVGSLVLGGLLLFDRPGFDLRVDPRQLVGLALFVGVVVVLAVLRVRRAHRQPITTGEEGLVGAVGEVIESGFGAGRVRIGGEEWSAHWPGRLEAGTPVRVDRVAGLHLEVQSLPYGESP